MTAEELLRKQIELSNTAHQREVADLQAAGLNPILSANGSGASTPNILTDGLVGASGSSSGKNSAKAIRAAGAANPVNKAIGLAGKALDVVKKNSIDQALREIHPERYTAAVEAANKNQQNFWNQYSRNNSNNANSNTNVNQSSNNTQSNNTNSGSQFAQTVNSINRIIHPVTTRLAEYARDNISGSTMESLGDFIGLFNYKIGNAIKKLGRIKKNNEN